MNHEHARAVISLETARFPFPVHAGRQKTIVELAFLACAACGVLHVTIGADPLVPALAVLTMALGMVPVLRAGVWNIGAILVFFVAFRHVGFPLFAKLALAQPLDTNLGNPLASFTAVALGVLGYFLAFTISSNVKVGLPLLRPLGTARQLRHLSFLAFLVGFIANLDLALRVNVQIGVWNISNSFLTCLHLALIAAAASALLRSNMHRMLDGWTIAIFSVELVFSIVQNTRSPILEAVLALAVTDVAFHGRFSKKQAAITIAALITFIAITPLIMYVRGFRADMPWKERVATTVTAIANWKEARMAFLEYQEKAASSSVFFMRYYDNPTNIFERLSHVNDTDVLITGAERTGKFGFKVIDRAVQHALPRFMVPDKPVDYGEGGWIYAEYEGSNLYGNFQTAPLIGVGYAAFGWGGVILFPIVFGSLLFLMIKKIVGFNILGNVWAIYVFIVFNNDFVEGGTWSYSSIILRKLPQDMIVMLLFAALIGVSRITLRKTR